MLKLIQGRFDVPVEHEGEHFTLVMTDITGPEFAKEVRRKDGGTDEERVAQAAEMLELVQRHIVDWREVGDEDGNPLPFSEHGLGLLLNDFGRVFAIYWAWMKARRERATGN